MDRAYHVVANHNNASYSSVAPFLVMFILTTVEMPIRRYGIKYEFAVRVSA